jgi:phosphoribosyl 1,2-cyclic phosphodiesterase
MFLERPDLRIPLPGLIDLIFSRSMSIRFTILGSSSSGNCALMATEHTRILIDAGFSARRIKKMLEDTGESIGNIDAVFLTHEHTDHTAGLNGLSRHQHLRVFANRGTAHAIQPRLKVRPNWQIFETGTEFSFRDLTIESFSIPHDAHDPVGFIFSCGNDDLFEPRRSIAWLTDLGYATELVRDRVRLADVLVLESNHDLDMLKADTRRPWSVKQRITGRHGHLSNLAARELLGECHNPAWKHVFLAHLSQDCNSLEAVERMFSDLRTSSKIPYSLATISPYRPAMLTIDLA